ncbi:MAG: hypothetical protein ACYDD1_15170 [Caulobacteraceae bacterium]
MIMAMKMYLRPPVLAAYAAMALGLAACADGTGPMGEPAHGVQGLKNAEKADAQSKAAGNAPPRGGGSAIAPSGPDGDPTAGPTETIGPH